MPPCFGNNVMFCRGRIGMGRIGMGRTGSDCIGTGSFCTAKTFYLEQSVVFAADCSIRIVLSEPNHDSPPEYNDSPPENLDEHHFFAVKGNMAFTSAEVRFSTRLICSFDERNSKRSRLAKSYFCVLLKSRNEFTS